MTLPCPTMLSSLPTEAKPMDYWLIRKYRRKNEARAYMIKYYGTFHERKRHRTEHFEKYVKGWKLRACGACSGSGIYDDNGAPPCGACFGTGRERYKSEE